MWLEGCQSRVKARVVKKPEIRLITGIIRSPLLTPNVPPGKKSFCTSTTSKASCLSIVIMGPTSLKRVATNYRRHGLNCQEKRKNATIAYSDLLYQCGFTEKIDLF